MGSAAAVAAAGAFGQARASVSEPPSGAQWQPLGEADRRPLARPAGGVSALRHLPRPPDPLAAGRHLGADLAGAVGPGRRGGRTGLGACRRGRHDRAGPPACRRGPANARPSGSPWEKGGTEPVAGEALGRSRGGLTTKIHLAGEGKGRPLAVVVSEGQRHDSTQLEAVLDRIRVPRQGKDGRRRRGRPRKRPQRLLLDKGYAYPKCRRALRRRGIPSMIPERQDQRQHRLKQGSRGGRPCRFSREEYRQRAWIERLINRLKQWRRIATRYEKRAQNYQAFVLIGCVLLWLPH